MSQKDLISHSTVAPLLRNPCKNTLLLWVMHNSAEVECHPHAVKLSYFFAK